MADAARSDELRNASMRRWDWLGACLRDPKVVAGGGFILFLLVLAVGAPWIAPKDPLEQDIILGATPPAWLAGAEPGHWLGTDDLGRDALSRVIYGSRVALTVGLCRIDSRGAAWRGTRTAG